MTNVLVSKDKVPAWRVFTAVQLPEALGRKLAQACETAKSKLEFKKWVDERDYHITLQFLGDVKPEQIGKMTEVLYQAALRCRSFTLKVSGQGVFGRSEAPSVLWAGLDGDTESLSALQSEVSHTLQPLGFEPERRPYHPHITLARKYQGECPFPSDAGEMIPSLGEWNVDSFVLYRTRLGRAPMYEVLDRWKLR
ncbi:RNA 2',3'-cyclic phosphodiesterase [Paenibacillus sp. CAA11]|uniref:RNA 2',3'-cyclic phosphodiesterase n=1 Tax=Paenibacillus sp. CAA11 TaxID=1532905 RepID=UPI000D36DA73|nr:RNA 2',3'-cyclic phosphodiesterase [Paenibacillus sp. CAA11]AWB43607.1 RNA 2',3'-cyclic phosphodiesterase [Paenibacillus sp. CAA11]